jgi:hypothetical protein
LLCESNKTHNIHCVGENVKAGHIYNKHCALKGSEFVDTPFLAYATGRSSCQWDPISGLAALSGGHAQLRVR